MSIRACYLRCEQGEDEQVDFFDLQDSKTSRHFRKNFQLKLTTTTCRCAWYSNYGRFGCAAFLWRLLQRNPHDLRVGLRKYLAPWTSASVLHTRTRSGRYCLGLSVWVRSSKCSQQDGSCRALTRQRHSIARGKTTGALGPSQPTRYCVLPS